MLLFCLDRWGKADWICISWSLYPAAPEIITYRKEKFLTLPPTTAGRLVSADWPGAAKPVVQSTSNQATESFCFGPRENYALTFAKDGVPFLLDNWIKKSEQR